MLHRGLFAALGVFALAGCSSVPRPPVPLVAHVELERFMGDWYVIAHVPSRAEHDVLAERAHSRGAIAIQGSP